MELIEKPITIVGCGPGSLEYLTPMARRAIDKAETLMGAERLLELFPESLAEKIAVGGDVKAALAAISERLRRKKITVLVTGDPGLCSLAHPVIDQFGIDACMVIPGVSSIQAAFARAGVDWLDARILSAHGREPDVDAESCRENASIAILAGNQMALRWIADFAEKLGGRRAVVCENLTLPNERVREMDAAALCDIEASPQTVVLLLKGKDVK